jgi:NAD(P)H-hydrate repair Nnr-like enzyme with NAD(P)H-hydrate dehydratase domain
MFLIIGTIPEKDFPVVFGGYKVEGNKLSIAGRNIPINRGTSALAASAWMVSDSLSTELPMLLRAGDRGSGEGSIEIYKWLLNNLHELAPSIVVFHYLQPEIFYHSRILKSLRELDKMPVLVADAGYMYSAKMSGYASDYDLFTPDIGEMAYIADEKAPHPFYTRGFLLHENIDVKEKIERAYKHGNASKTLLVKGEMDYIANNGKIIEIIDSPMVEALEPIGGTGDTITGIVSALINSGLNPVEASIKACKINRIAGNNANPTPATQVSEIIREIPNAVVSIAKHINTE